MRPNKEITTRSTTATYALFLAGMITGIGIGRTDQHGSWGNAIYAIIGIGIGVLVLSAPNRDKGNNKEGGNDETD